MLGKGTSIFGVPATLSLAVLLLVSAGGCRREKPEVYTPETRMENPQYRAELKASFDAQRKLAVAIAAAQKRGDTNEVARLEQRLEADRKATLSLVRIRKQEAEANAEKVRKGEAQPVRISK